MSKYVYAAVFTKEENGQYSVTFNDIKGCYTCGDNLEEAIEMAEDALALVLYEYEKEGREIPKATDISEIKTGENEFVTYIACDNKFFYYILFFCQAHDSKINIALRMPADGIKSEMATKYVELVIDDVKILERMQTA